MAGNGNDIVHLAVKPISVKASSTHNKLRNTVWARKQNAVEELGQQPSESNFIPDSIEHSWS
ncbi:unnamed protein product [Sphenostylis stenocarpa]|uniref:Uncharacterized protein n=1 Tax=Sphenostylis stenocarpa TaxID=92480 RepID=A0AA86S8V0_9FABA|nr:unnamed protein product [Sphenostylis stenocarpa]